MQVTPLAIPDLLVLVPRLFEDERGFFTERYNRADFADAVGRDVDFVQDNHSRSRRNVLRGLHYQLPPQAQAKLVGVVRGEVFDVAVDLRRSSPTFGRWAGVTLSETNRRQLWVPEGFAHGFVVLSDVAELIYKTSDYYSPSCDRSLAWDDAQVAIDWPLEDPPILSGKDAAAPALERADLFD